jgi:hypothetical protein
MMGLPRPENVTLAGRGPSAKGTHVTDIWAASAAAATAIHRWLEYI